MAGFTELSLGEMMRAVAQRVSSASVSVDQQVVGSIQRGLLILLGVEQGDQPRDVEYISEKLIGLRVFEDAGGKMNRSVVDVEGSILLVSQFTLLADTGKGRRPSFLRAADPSLAEALYEQVAVELRKKMVVATGRFQAHMQVASVNDGPVTILLDSRREI